VAVRVRGAIVQLAGGDRRRKRKRQIPVKR